jgi:hypothetical protein
VDSYNSLVEAYIHDSNNNLAIGGSTTVGDTKRPPTPRPHLPALKGEGSVVPLSRSAGGRGGGRVRFAGRPLAWPGSALTFGLAVVAFLVLVLDRRRDVAKGIAGLGETCATLGRSIPPPG